MVLHKLRCTREHTIDWKGCGPERLPLCLSSRALCAKVTEAGQWCNSVATGPFLLSVRWDRDRETWFGSCLYWSSNHVLLPGPLKDAVLAYLCEVCRVYFCHSNLLPVEVVVVVNFVCVANGNRKTGSGSTKNTQWKERNTSSRSGHISSPAYTLVFDWQLRDREGMHDNGGEIYSSPECRRISLALPNFVSDVPWSIMFTLQCNNVYSCQSGSM